MPKPMKLKNYKMILKHSEGKMIRVAYRDFPNKIETINLIKNGAAHEHRLVISARKRCKFFVLNKNFFE